MPINLMGISYLPGSCGLCKRDHFLAYSSALTASFKVINVIIVLVLLVSIYICNVNC